MKFIRKALLPGVIAAGLLGFLGAAGASADAVTLDFNASDGDVCRIIGHDSIAQGETVRYTAVVQNPDEWEIKVDLNDYQGGNSDIVAVNGTSVPNVDFVDDAELDEGANICGDDDDDLEAATIAANKVEFRALVVEGIDQGEVCSGAPPLDVFACQDFTGPWGGTDIDCGLVPVLGDQCSISPAIINAVVDALAVERANGAACNELDEIAEDAAILAGATEFVAAQFNDYFDGRCAGDVIPGEPDGYVTVDVKCYDAGVFDLTFAPEGHQGASIQVVCGGPVYSADITARPLTVEIVPSLNNVSHSLVTVELWDRNDKPAVPGTNVYFTVDRCSVETSGVNNEEKYLAAAGVFNAYNPLVSTSGIAVETHASATTSVDSASRQADEATSFTIRAGDTVPETGADRERTVAAAIVGCNPVDAPGVTPGKLTLTALVDRAAPLDDIVLTQEITVVGPPAANGVTVTAAPASLACGEKATISVDVKDAAGQPVSDHTWVEAVTNHGGVLAGTGAVAGQAGLVSPVSSTVAETFGGKATIYLLTSTAHVGKYEVVITTGGGGGVTGQNPGIPQTNLLGGLFTTAPISVQVTVECTVPTTAAPQPGPDTSGPQTGQGIRPPSTGDAGLVSTESNSWALGAVAAVAAALAVAGLSVKLVREE